MEMLYVQKKNEQSQQLQKRQIKRREGQNTLRSGNGIYNLLSKQ
jgi:hypothetical protein